MKSFSNTEQEIIEIWNYDETKLKSYLNSNHNVILSFLFNYEDNNDNKIKTKFLRENIHKSHKEILLLLKHKNEYYSYYKNLILLLTSHNLDEHNFQVELGKINEKTGERKSNGVYYTPEDVSDFMIYNSIFQLIANEFKVNFKPKNKEEIIKTIFKLSKKYPNRVNEIISKCSVIDPTCGTGAFLVQVLNIKLNLLNQLKNKINPIDVENVINNLEGNDLDPFSTYITKTRIIFKALFYCKEIKISSIMKTLDINFTTKNCILDELSPQKYDLVIGNPPYVERTKTTYGKFMKYGNTYAEIIHKSMDLLKKNGILSFIIPLSYISTNRMNSLRNFVEAQTEYQFILNYNDRPDCLFVGVHQKLSILFAKKNVQSQSKLYTSDYIYWYKNERNNLFNDSNIILNKIKINNVYLKLGKRIEENIIRKVFSFKNNLINLEDKSDFNKLYLNMRATYWIKSFITEPEKLNEYKIFNFSEDNLHLLNCILNSSLFWWYWVKISDCWHITNKELINFTIPKVDVKFYNKIKKLSLELNENLEKTKKKINTKQTLYEYKHKSCKKIIDKIDNELANIYGLTKEELNFVKHYKERYRLGQEGNKK